MLNAYLVFELIISDWAGNFGLIFIIAIL